MNGMVITAFKRILERREGIHGDVLEVGSMDINGTIRHLFKQPRFSGYTGMDMRPGKLVDIVANAHDMPFEDESFDVINCAEMLEHDSQFWVTMKEMYRVLRPEGHVILATRAFGYPKHDWPNDYWRFTEDGLRSVFWWANLKVLESYDPGQDRIGGVGSVAVAKKVK